MGIAAFLPRISFGLFLGSLLDRSNKGKIVTIADVTRATVLFILFLVSILKGFNLWAVFISVFVLGFGQSLSRIGVNSMVPDMVPGTRLGKANGHIAFTQEISTVLGSPLAGVAIAMSGVSLSIVLGSLSYVVSAFFLFRVSRWVERRKGVMRDTESASVSIVREINEGIRYVRSEKALLKLTISSIAGNFFTSFFLPFLVVYVSRILMSGTIIFGILNGLMGAGLGMGALLAGRRPFEDRFGAWFSISWGIAAIAILGLVLVPGIISSAIFLTAWGIGGGFGDTVFSTGVQKFVPSRLLARYLSIEEVMGLASSPAGQASGGVLVSMFGTAPIFMLASLGGSLSVLVLLLFPDVRRIGG